MPPFDISKPPKLLRLAVLLLALFSNISALSSRRSCLEHYLANQRTTGVYQVGNVPDIFSIVCEMPEEYVPGGDSTVTTVSQSGLHTPHIITDKRSVNFQHGDLNFLRDLVRNTDCRQTVTVEWKETPETAEDLQLISLLNHTINLKFNPEQLQQTVELVGPMAGIRHIFPAEEVNNRVPSAREQSAPQISASALRCSQPVVDKKQCLSRNEKLRVTLDGKDSYTFAFRTDLPTQTIIGLTSNGDMQYTRLENGYFLHLPSHPEPLAIGNLADSQWHSVTVDGTRLIVDTVEIQMGEDNSEFTDLEIILSGEVLLIDPIDLEDDCARISKISKEVESSPICSGCDCFALQGVFEGLSASSCQQTDEDGFHLLRDPDRLSFFWVNDAFTVNTEGIIQDIKTSISFKSDSDAGLVLFGYWQRDEGRGRVQVHYAGSKMSAVVCSTAEEESCSACSIQFGKGIGEDAWHRVALFGSGDKLTLILDDKACKTGTIAPGNNISTAEVYSVPSISSGVGLLVGGTFYEKKRKGLYKQDLEQKFFENTREKMPSLRGCVKDLYIDGRPRDLTLVYENQMKTTLVNSGDLQAYAIQIGCILCSPTCPEDVRCRSPTPLVGSLPVCDCADQQLVTSDSGTCTLWEPSPVPLSTRFLSTNHLVLPIPNTKAQLSTVWLRVRLPQRIRHEIVIAEFNSHRELMFRVIASPDSKLKVQAHPLGHNEFTAAVSKPIDLTDDRVHTLTINRRTPVGTRHFAKKFDLFIDGSRFELPESGKQWLNNVSLPVADGTDEKESVIIHALGIGYDYDEHMFIDHPTNKIHQIDLHRLLVPMLYRTPDSDLTGTLDPYLWEEQPETESYVDPATGAVSYGQTGDTIYDVLTDAQPSRHGEVVAYTPEVYEPELLLSGRWLVYSIIALILLLLILFVSLCLYCCLMKKKSSSSSSTASDRERMMGERDSPDYNRPDYMPVKMRPHSEVLSFNDDCSLGTDDTDLNAYRDIPSHRVKIYRESMVSILVPSMDEHCEAAIVKRPDPPQQQDNKDYSPTARSPPLSPLSPAPLVNVNDDEEVGNHY